MAWTAKPEVQVMRLAAIHATLDGVWLIGVPHLKAGLAVWRYCEASARYIFGDSTGDPVADRILSEIEKQGEPDRTAIRDLFGRNMPSAWIERALTLLRQARRITMERSTDSKGGRPRTVVRLLESTTKTTKS